MTSDEITLTNITKQIIIKGMQAAFHGEEKTLTGKVAVFYILIDLCGYFFLNDVFRFFAGIIGHLNAFLMFGGFIQYSEREY